VWLECAIEDGHCRFRADADSPIVRALVLFLCEFFSGASPADVALSPIDPFEALGISRQLTPTRRNGLHAVLATMRAFAQTHAS
jgi:cysteine desulfuration protein SufE